MTLLPGEVLPQDRDRACLIGRVWLPGEGGGPTPVRLDGDDVVSLLPAAPTVAELLAGPDPLAAAREAGGERLGDIADILANSAADARDPARPWLLAPCDLQALKACGVTFVKSMLERVIEEQAKGDPQQAAAVRAAIAGELGGSLSAVKPGSQAAARVRQVLLERGLWSQYLEVGIGPDAEVFTKAQPMAAVGPGAEVGIHPASTWNNPEPEAVLAVAPDGRIVGATLGNDVNLRDVEGRSALLLGRAKDNRASCAVGPFIRLFDEHFSLGDVRALEIRLHVEGADGFVLDGRSSMTEISRDPADLAAQALGPHNQYPDGLMLFTGTMFAPVEDRDAPGEGFTHHLGDVVRISAPALGELVNRVNRTDRIAPWTFGTGALMRNLAARSLI
ncbi:MAG TPA: fumarylacetoacetate hydrolase family protein [Alphaproteobacteria bacterium]|nr:fumarylacetoacetate hydrolase family protein [Alphaproteobacteria bacterium]